MSYDEADVIDRIHRVIVNGFDIDSVKHILFDWYALEKERLEVNKFPTRAIDKKIDELVGVKGK